MVGGGDGVVKIKRNCENNGRAGLASSWRALTNLLPSRRREGWWPNGSKAGVRCLPAGASKSSGSDAPREMCMNANILLAPVGGLYYHKTSQDAPDLT